jgi:hypothetical protein
MIALFSLFFKKKNKFKNKKNSFFELLFILKKKKEPGSFFCGPRQIRTGDLLVLPPLPATNFLNLGGQKIFGLERIRTADLRIANAALYQTKLRALQKLSR